MRRVHDVVRRVRGCLVRKRHANHFPDQPLRRSALSGPPARGDRLIVVRPLERVLRADDAEITRSVDPERVARNDATFREANERIHEAAQEYELQGPMPFICECAEATCTTIVRVTLPGYAEVRANPVRFIVAAGHELPDTDIEQVVERRGGYFGIEKVGRAADIAADLDP